jgi:hypothetical protein
MRAPALRVSTAMKRASLRPLARSALRFGLQVACHAERRVDVHGVREPLQERRGGLRFVLGHSLGSSSDKI